MTPQVGALALVAGWLLLTLAVLAARYVEIDLTGIVWWLRWRALRARVHVAWRDAEWQRWWQQVPTVDERNGGDAA